MKILFDHPLPFALAHGGLQSQIEQTMAALQRRGLEVEPVRWWDEHQQGDIIHFFGRPQRTYIDLAHAKGMKVVTAELHSAMGSRSAEARFVQKVTMRMAQVVLPRAFTAKLAWDAYRNADAFIALTGWEATIIQTMFDAEPRKIHIVPNGVEEAFFRPHMGGDYLVCTAAIDPRKRVVELAAAAARAQVPLWIVGKPYSESDDYYRRFVEVQQKQPKWIRYEGAIADRGRLAQIYSEARGFVLVSTQESLSISALEAAAAGCPLLLSDLPWARTTFGDHAQYLSAGLETEAAAKELRDFHDKAPTLVQEYRPLHWDDVGALLAELYEQLVH